MPQKDEALLAKLGEAVTAIYDMGFEFINDSNIILLQKLKSDDLDGRLALFSNLLNIDSYWPINHLFQYFAL